METKDLIYKLKMYGFPCHSGMKTLMQEAADALERQEQEIEKLTRDRDALRALVESVG